MIRKDVSTAGAEDMVTAILGALSANSGKAAELLAIHYKAEMLIIWRQNSMLYEAFAAALLSAGKPSRAYDLVREGREHHPGSARLALLEALALCDVGNNSRAEKCVSLLLDRPDLQDDPKLLVDAHCLVGRIAKDRYLRAGAAAARKKYARLSAQAYEVAFARCDDTFPAINAATMSLLGGASKRTGELARYVRDQAETQLEMPGNRSDYWLHATLGEAHVLLGETGEAAKCYAEAARLAGNRHGHIGSMRRNLVLIQRARPDLAGLDQVIDALGPGCVLVFSGHMVDHPDRVAGGIPARFPADPVLETKVKAAIDAMLDKFKPVVAYCSVACGSDILFAEQVLDRRERPIELHVVLPFALDDFLKKSVDFGLDSMRGWRERCEKILAPAVVHHATGERFLGDEVLFGFVNDLSQGLALLRARQLSARAQALVVLDPMSSKAFGGTAYFLERWRKTHHPAEIIDLAALRGDAQEPPNLPMAPPPKPAKAKGQFKRSIQCMLFADVHGFSKLSEEQSPRFFVEFLNRLAKVLRGQETDRLLFRNTWGDGLYAVFDGPVPCARVALRFLENIANTNWERLGLPADLSVRVAMHAGPVYRRFDPVIRRQNYFGSHVNRAARVEPVTPPGCAYATEQFAALLEAQADHDFVCEYVGIEALAKGFDTVPLYRLARGRGE